MIKRKDVPEHARGIYCPVARDGIYCSGATCAWWVDDDESHGHCAALDWGRSADVPHSEAPSSRVSAYVPCPMPDYDGRGQL